MPTTIVGAIIAFLVLAPGYLFVANQRRLHASRDPSNLEFALSAITFGTFIHLFFVLPMGIALAYYGISYTDLKQFGNTLLESRFGLLLVGLFVYAMVVFFSLTTQAILSGAGGSGISRISRLN